MFGGLVVSVGRFRAGNRLKNYQTTILDAIVIGLERS